MTEPADDGPWGPYRRQYFLRRHEEGLRRQAAAREAADEVAGRVAELERELASVRSAIERATVGGGHWFRLITSDEELQARLTRLRRRHRELRRQTQATHGERLHEWAVHNDHRPPPEPGQLLLARRSKKPYRDL